MLKNIIRWIIYVPLFPFKLIAFILGLYFVLVRANKYRANPTAYTEEQRYRWALRTIKRLLWLKRIDVEAGNLNSMPKSPMLIICNHKSNIDPIAIFKVLYAHRNTRYENFSWVYIAKKELSRKNLMFKMLNLIDIVYLDRDDIRQQLRVYNSQVEAVRKEKKSVVIFIEGHRFFEDEFGPFHPGSLKIAYDCMIPILPIVVYGSSGLMDSNKKYINKKRTIYFNILKPLNPLDFNTTKIDYLSEQLQKKMQENYYLLKTKQQNGEEVVTNN